MRLIRRKVKPTTHVCQVSTLKMRQAKTPTLFRFHGLMLLLQRDFFFYHSITIILIYFLKVYVKLDVEVPRCGLLAHRIMQLGTRASAFRRNVPLPSAL